MNQLITITQNENNDQVVSARELHKVLGVKKRFSEWWEQNSKLLVEHEDFEGVLISTPYNPKFPDKVQKLQDYAVTSDNAKHLAMQSQTKKSREIRDYFIQVEKEYKQQQAPLTLDQQIAAIATGYGSVKEELVEVKDRVLDLEENAPLSAGEYNYIGSRITQRVNEVAHGYSSITQKQRGELYKDINRGVKVVTGISTRTQLRTKHFDTAMDFINNWEPSTATKMQLRQMSFDFEE
ncbi:MAG: antA/AntB antirepressor family protein [Lactococcus lactis]